jgi:hypothetical protein
MSYLYGKFTYQITQLSDAHINNSIEHDPSLEAGSRLGVQKTHCLLRKSEDHSTKQSATERSPY